MTDTVIKDNKTQYSLSLSGTVQSFLERTGLNLNIPKSEIAEHLIRAAAGLPTDNSRNILVKLFEVKK